MEEEPQVDSQVVVASDRLAINMQFVEYTRSLSNIVGGVIAGILGLTGLAGFLMYFLLHLLTCFLIITRMNMNTQDYIRKTAVNFILSDAFSNIMSYVLFWTLSFSLIHVYDN